MAAPKTNLSARGEVFAAPGSKVPMLDVVCDLWHPETNPGGYVSLGVAENTLMHTEIIEYMTKTFSIDSRSLTYGDGFSGSHRLRKTIARFINARFFPVTPVAKSHVLVTSGLGPAIELCGFSLCDKGDGVLLARPYYGSFPVDMGYRAEAQIIGVSFGTSDPMGLETVQAYEAALEEARCKGIRVRALLLCNPHNPLGRCYTRELLEAYMRFCQKHSLHLISDEIYALSIWENPDAPDAPGFTSVLSIDTADLIDPSLVHVLWGMSKDFGSNGIRLGCVVSQNNAPFLRSLESNSYFACPSALADLATSRILSDDAFVETYTQTNRKRLAENYTLTVRFLKDQKIPYEKGANAGFFVWVDLFEPIREQVNTAVLNDLGLESSETASRRLEAKLQEALLKNRIFLASGAAFGSDIPGWFRIVFAHDQDYLKLGLGRMVEAVETFGRELGDAKK
ncbi:putative 1-aminocyclopropane-1-carboxylate synthase [Plectosphaerella plurivora]|uniref:1-aminocyclopropane-1-carboxylate synthase n=1 Tax=Plectosphaerella plurivora TaxID=936078 RepID=A0A9P8VKC4_9PEZI|nr:putative 1-aminocyclopropane-1-carboxylate synthase [Plectosphaerella plurivora]